MILYKLFRVKKGKLYPLYVFANEEIVLGEKLYAKEGPRTKDGRVKGKLGRLSFRPGWHLTELPLADHIGKRQENGELYQATNTVWCEVEIPDELYDYTEDLKTRKNTIISYGGEKYKPIGNILGGFSKRVGFTSWEKTINCKYREFYKIAKDANAMFDVYENIATGEWFIPSDMCLMLLKKNKLSHSKNLKRVEEYDIPARNRCMKCLPANGYYWYTTNASAKVKWLISEQMIVRRVLTNEEVAKLCREHGYEPQPIEK